MTPPILFDAPNVVMGVPRMADVFTVWGLALSHAATWRRDIVVQLWPAFFYSAGCRHDELGDEAGLPHHGPTGTFACY